jgi:ELWxxDGT repeat protein
MKISFLPLVLLAWFTWAECCRADVWREVVPLATFQPTISYPKVVRGGGGAFESGTPGYTPFFCGSDKRFGNELWQINGDEAHLAWDIRPGPESSNPAQFQNIGSTLIFVADDGVHGPEIRARPIDWSSSIRALHDFQPGNDHAAPVLLGNATPLLSYAQSRPIWFSTEGYEGGVPVTFVWACADLDSTPVKAGTYALGSIGEVKQDASGSGLFYSARLPGSDRHALFWVEGTAAAVQIGFLSQTATTTAPLPPEMFAVTLYFVVYAQRATNGSWQFHQHDLDTGSGTSLGRQSTGAAPMLATDGWAKVCCHTTQGLWLVEKTSTSLPASQRALATSGAGTAASQPSPPLMAWDGQGVFFQANNQQSGRSLFYVPTASPGETAVEVDADIGGVDHVIPVASNAVAYTKPHAGLLDFYFWDSWMTAPQRQVGAVSSISALHRPDDSFAMPLTPRLLVEGFWPDQTDHKALFRLDRWSGLSHLASFPPGFSMKGSFLGIGLYDASYFAYADYVGETPQEWPNELIRFHIDGWPQSTSVSLGVSDGGGGPGDFCETSGGLYLTAENEGRRWLYHSANGAPSTLQVVSGLWDAEQLVKSGERLFVLGRGTSSDAGAKALFEVTEAGSSPGVMRFGGASGEDVLRLISAGSRLYYLAAQNAAEDALYSVASGGVGGVFIQNVLESSPGAASIESHFVVGDALFFRAKHASGETVLWRTDGTTITSATGTSGTPHLLGAWSGQCAFWTDEKNGGYKLWRWNGSAAPVLWHAGSLEDAPDVVYTNGKPSGVEWQGGFYLCTRKGVLMRADGAGLQAVAGIPSKVRAESLAALPEKLLFSHESTQGDSWLMSLAAGAQELPHYLPPYFPQVRDHLVLDGMVWYLTGNPYEALLCTDGTEAGTTSYHIDENVAGHGALGTFRGRPLVPGSIHSGPYLVNAPPVLTASASLPVFRRNQANTFTYEQIVPQSVTDPDGDVTGPLTLVPFTYSGLRRNGVLMSGPSAIYPGDVFEFTLAPFFFNGRFYLPGWLEASDSWSSGSCSFGSIETAHADWSRQQFTESELADASISGLNADPDGDGVVNGIELVLGRGPKSRESEPGWGMSLEAGGGITRTAVFRFTRLAAIPPGLEMRVMISDDLKTWSSRASRSSYGIGWSTTSGTSVTEIPLPDGRVEVSVRLPGLPSSAFMRLEASYE